MIAAQLEDLESKVRAWFSDGAPNGWALGWARDRLQPELARVAAPYPCSNATSFDYSRCNRYEIQVGRGSADHEVLTLLLSFLANVFVAFWTRYQDQGKTGQVVGTSSSPDGERLEQAVRQVLAQRAFQEIPEQWYSHPLDGVELELSESADVTLGKCLFEDYDG